MIPELEGRDRKSPRGLLAWQSSQNSELPVKWETFSNIQWRAVEVVSDAHTIHSQTSKINTSSLEENSV